MATTPPGPKANPLIGTLLEFRRDKLAMMTRMARDYGDVVRYRLGPVIAYQINHPDYIHEILVNQAANLNKSSLDHQVFERFSGQGLLISEGEFHKHQRRLMQPVFHSKRIEAYGQIMVDYTERMIAGWREGATFEVHREMTKLTMQIVSKTLYDADFSSNADEIGHAMEALNSVGDMQYRQGFVIPAWVPARQNVRSKKALKVLDDLLIPMIEARRKSGEDKGDLLSMLLMAQDEESGGQMSNKQVRDEVATLFAAGHETTTNALAWAWYLLAKHPETEAKLQAEIDSVLAGRAPTLADLKAMPYLDSVIKETLRLYPPAWILNGRVPQKDLTIGGYTLKAKSGRIFIAPYVLHRDGRWFDAPDKFDPERWTRDGELEKRLPRYAYFPFGGGPRVCIGNNFAQMEMKLVLATVASQARLTLATPEVTAPDPQVTLRPRGGIMMRVRNRVPAAVEAPMMA
jgi:cytochrome P450